MTAILIEGHPHLADWLFLIGAFLALLAAIAYAPKANTPKFSPWSGTLIALAVCSLAVAWLVL